MDPIGKHLIWMCTMPIILDITGGILVLYLFHPTWGIMIVAPWFTADWHLAEVSHVMWLSPSSKQFVANSLLFLVSSLSAEIRQSRRETERRKRLLLLIWVITWQPADRCPFCPLRRSRSRRRQGEEKLLIRLFSFPGQRPAQAGRDPTLKSDPTKRLKCSTAFYGQELAGEDAGHQVCRRGRRCCRWEPAWSLTTSHQVLLKITGETLVPFRASCIFSLKPRLRPLLRPLPWTSYSLHLYQVP